MKLVLYTISMFIISYYLFSQLSVDKQRAIRYSDTVCTKALMDSGYFNGHVNDSRKLCDHLSKQLIGMY